MGLDLTLMGLDLTLLPFDADFNHLTFSHTVLSCEQRADLFSAIAEVEKQVGQETPALFSSCMATHPAPCHERGYGFLTITPYGQHLQYVRVSDLLPFREHPDVMGNVKNRAIWAYLSMLEPTTKVALFWH